MTNKEENRALEALKFLYYLKDCDSCPNYTEEEECTLCEDASDILLELIIKEETGCESCAFVETEEWEMPCAKCIRNCKDYWREVGR